MEAFVSQSLRVFRSVPDTLWPERPDTRSIHEYDRVRNAVWIRTLGHLSKSGSPNT